MPQLQAVSSRIHGADRGHGGGIELLRTIGILSKAQQLRLGVVGQVQAHDLGGPFLIPQGHQALQEGPVDLGDLGGGQEAAVPAEAHLDGLGGVIPQGAVPCAVIFHMSFLAFRNGLIM